MQNKKYIQKIYFYTAQCYTVESRQFLISDLKVMKLKQVGPNFYFAFTMQSIYIL